MLKLILDKAIEKILDLIFQKNADPILQDIVLLYNVLAYLSLVIFVYLNGFVY
jgi:hypothetical protein